MQRFSIDFNEPAIKVTYHEEDNVNEFEFLKKREKTIEDFKKMPHFFCNATQDYETLLFKYNYKERIKQFNPAQTDDPLTFEFFPFTDSFTDINYFNLKVTVINDTNNFLQYDTPLIESFKIYSGGKLLEEVNNVSLIEDFYNDLYYTSNIFENNFDKNKNRLCLDTMGILLPPKERGTNLIFNPPTYYENYTDCPIIVGGVPSTKLNYKRVFNCKIRSKLFGDTSLERVRTCSGIDDLGSLTPMFAFPCMKVVVKLNKYAFFVPVFNARITDLVNVQVDNDEIARYRENFKQLKELEYAQKNFKMYREEFTLNPSGPSMIDQENGYTFSLRPQSVNRNMFFIDNLSQVLAAYHNVTDGEGLLLKLTEFMKQYRIQISKFIHFFLSREFSSVAKMLSNINKSNADSSKLSYFDFLLDPKAPSYTTFGMKSAEDVKKVMDTYNTPFPIYPLVAESEGFKMHAMLNEKWFYKALLIFYAYGISLQNNVPIEIYEFEYPENISETPKSATYICSIRSYLNASFLRLAYTFKVNKENATSMNSFYILDLKLGSKAMTGLQVNSYDIFNLDKFSEAFKKVFNGDVAFSSVVNFKFFDYLRKIKEQDPNKLKYHEILRLLMFPINIFIKNKESYKESYELFDRLMESRNYSNLVLCIDAEKLDKHKAEIQISLYLNEPLKNLKMAPIITNSGIIKSRFTYNIYTFELEDFQIFWNSVYEILNYIKTPTTAEKYATATSKENFTGEKFRPLIIELCKKYYNRYTNTQNSLWKAGTNGEVIFSDVEVQSDEVFPKEIEDKNLDWFKKLSDSLIYYLYETRELMSIPMGPDFKINVTCVEKLLVFDLSNLDASLKEMQNKQDSIMNMQFIRKLKSRYSTADSYNMLKHYMPMLFNYEKDEKEIKERIETIDNETSRVTLKKYVTTNFLNNFTSVHQLETYNPFKYFGRFEQKRSASLSEKLQRLGSSLKDIDVFNIVDFSNPQNFYLRTAMLISKAHNKLLKNNLINRNVIEPFYDQFLLSKLRQNCVFAVSSGSKDPFASTMFQLKQKTFFDTAIWKYLKYGAAAATIVVCGAYLVSIIPFAEIGTAITTSLGPYFGLDKVSDALNYIYTYRTSLSDIVGGVAGYIPSFSMPSLMITTGGYQVSAIATAAVAMYSFAMSAGTMVSSVASFATAFSTPLLCLLLPVVAIPVMKFTYSAIKSRFFAGSDIARMNEIKDEKDNKLFERTLISNAFYEKKQEQSKESLIDLKILFKRFLKANRKSCQSFYKEQISIEEVKKTHFPVIESFANFNTQKAEKTVEADNLKNTAKDVLDRNMKELIDLVRATKFKDENGNPAKEITDLQAITDEIYKVCVDWSTNPKQVIKSLEFSGGRSSWAGSLELWADEKIFGKKVTKDQAKLNTAASDDIDYIFRNYVVLPLRKQVNKIEETDADYFARLYTFRNQNYAKIFELMRVVATSMFENREAIEKANALFPMTNMDIALSAVNKMGLMYVRNYTPLNKYWIYETPLDNHKIQISEGVSVDNEGVKTKLENTFKRATQEISFKITQTADALRSINQFMVGAMDFNFFEVLGKSADKSIKPVMRVYENDELNTALTEEVPEVVKDGVKELIPLVMEDLYKRPLVFCKNDWEEIIDNAPLKAKEDGTDVEIELKGLKGGADETPYKTYKVNVSMTSDTICTILDAIKLISLRNLVNEGKLQFDDLSNVIVVPSGKAERGDNFNRLFRGLENEYLMMSDPLEYVKGKGQCFKKINGLYDPKDDRIKEKLRLSNIDKIEDQLIGVVGTPGFEKIATSFLVNDGKLKTMKFSDALKVKFNINEKDDFTNYFLINEYSEETFEALKKLLLDQDNAVATIKKTVSAYMSIGLLVFNKLKEYVGKIKDLIAIVDEGVDKASIKEEEKKIVDAMVSALPEVSQRFFEQFPLEVDGDGFVKLYSDKEEIKDYEKLIFFQAMKAWMIIKNDKNSENLFGASVGEKEKLPMDYNYQVINAFAKYFKDSVEGKVFFGDTAFRYNPAGKENIFVKNTNLFMYMMLKKSQADFTPEDDLADFKKSEDSKNEKERDKLYDSAYSNFLRGQFLPGKFIKVPALEDNVFYEVSEVINFGDSFDIMILRQFEKIATTLKKEEFGMDLKKEFNFPFEMQVEDDILKDFNFKSREYVSVLDKRMLELEKEVLNKRNTFMNNSISDLMTLMRLLKQEDSKINEAVYFSVFPVYLNILSSLVQTGKISAADIAALSLIPEELDDMIQSFNEKSKDKKIQTFNEVLDQVEDPKIYEEAQKNIRLNFQEMLKPKVQSFKEFREQNLLLNAGSKMTISRDFTFECALEIKEVKFKDDLDYIQRVLSSGAEYKVSGKKMRILYQGASDGNLPETLSVSMPQNFTNAYILILSQAYKKYPTFRRSTRYNLGCKSFYLEVNGVFFPPFKVNGNFNDNEQNEEIYRYNLPALPNTSNLNRDNTAIDLSTTDFITRKIYTTNNQSPMEFEDDTYSNFQFGYHNEVLGKHLFTINNDTLKNYLEGLVGLTVVDVNIHFDNSGFKNEFEPYEIFILSEEDYSL